MFMTGDRCIVDIRSIKQKVAVSDLLLVQLQRLVFQPMSSNVPAQILLRRRVERHARALKRY